MNKARRATLNRIINALTDLKDELETVKDDEECAMDNMPESLHGSERYDTMEEAANGMDEALDMIGNAIDALEEVI